MFATRDVLKFVQPKWCSFEFQVFTSPSEGREPLQAMVIATRAFRPYLRRIFQKQTIHGWFSCVSLKWSLNNRRVQPTWPQDVEIIDASRLWDSQRRPRGLSLEKLVLPQQVAFGHPSAPTDLWRFLLVSKRSLYLLCRLWTYRNWTKQGCLKSWSQWNRGISFQQSSIPAPNWPLRRLVAECVRCAWATKLCETNKIC